MRIRLIGILLLKLWGLSCLVDGILGIVQAALGSATVPADETTRYVVMASALGAIVNLILGAALMLGADRIVGFIEPDFTSEPGQTPTGPDPYTLEELQSLLFGGIGAYLGILALSSIGALVYAIARQPAWDQTGQLAYALEGRQEQLATAAVQFALSVVLLFNRRALAAVWSRVRPMKRTA